MTTDANALHQQADSDREVGSEYGNAYLEWKDWDENAFGVLSRREEADLSAQLRKAKVQLPAGSRVLEIGFGNGTFLTYGAKRQWEMHGAEVNQGLVERARQKGFHAVQTETLAPFPDDQFHLVVAFDVMEHIPQDKIVEFLGEVRRVLKDGGVFMARFPNGDSPFGRFGQNGDPTHLTTIGSVKARFFALKAGMQIRYLGGEAQPLMAGWSYFAYRLISMPTKYVLNRFLNFLFFPREPKALCSPNLILILQAAKSARSGGAMRVVSAA
jgi:SAM-dependent methyltransferase